MADSTPSSPPPPAGADSQYPPSSSSSSYNSSASSYFNHLPTYARVLLIIACIVAFLFIFSTIMVCIYRCRRRNSNSSLFRFRRRRVGGSRSSSSSAAFQEISRGKESPESRDGGVYYGLGSGYDGRDAEMQREGKGKGVVESTRELADEEDGYGFGYAGAREREVLMNEAVLKEPQRAMLQEQDVEDYHTAAWAGQGRRDGDVEHYYGQHQQQEQQR